MSQNPDDDQQWSSADIAAMITGRDSARDASTSAQYSPNVELSPGFQHDEGEYVIDPDHAEILSLDYDDLVKRKVDINRR